MIRYIALILLLTSLQLYSMQSGLSAEQLYRRFSIRVDEAETLEEFYDLEREIVTLPEIYRSKAQEGLNAQRFSVFLKRIEDRFEEIVKCKPPCQRAIVMQDEDESSSCSS